jgi:hypothetical protein
MTFSRRSALEYASVLAATSGITEPGLAATALRAAFSPGQHQAKSEQQTAQRLRHLLIHRDEAGGTPHLATLSIASADTAWMAINTLDDAAYREAVGKYRQRGYRLRRVNAFQTRNGIRYAAIWQLASGPDWQARHAMTLAQFQQEAARFKSRGYRIAHVDGCATKSGTRYAAIWERGNAAAQETFAALTGADYKEKFDSLTAQGFRPRQISGYAQNGQAHFAAIFEKGSAVAWDAHREMTASAFQTKSDAMAAQGYRLMDASGFVTGGRPMFSGIWEKA